MVGRWQDGICTVSTNVETGAQTLTMAIIANAPSWSWVGEEVVSSAPTRQSRHGVRQRTMLPFECMERIVTAMARVNVEDNES